jgi:hypothetical protein
MEGGYKKIKALFPAKRKGAFLTCCRGVNFLE